MISSIHNENYEQNNDTYTIFCNRFEMHNDTQF